MVPDDSITSSWRHVVQEIKDSGQISARQMGFLDLAVPQGLIGNTLLLTVPNELTRQVLEGQLQSVLSQALHTVFQTELRCAFSIDSSLQTVTPEPTRPPEPSYDRAHAVDNYVDNAPRRFGSEDAPRALHPDSRPRTDPDYSSPTTILSARTNPAPSPEPHALDTTPTDSEERTRLNPRYHFESFVTGSSNRFAHAAANAVAEAPAKAYNPLFVYGESGLGKTHLLHAIGHYAQELYRGLRVRYVNSEEFTNDFINSIRHDEGASFKQIYRNVDILLIDDIQFMANKEATVEEFFHTFNALYNNNKQVVITSDLPPKQLSGFEERLRSRFEWGLTTDIQPPDLETRIAILNKKAESDGLYVPTDALEYIASRISTNIRELEGALIRVAAYASLNRTHIDYALAEHVLKDLIPDEDSQEITSGLILDETMKYFDFTLEELQSKSRTKKLVNARQISMYLLRELTEMSLPRIGAELGGRDHTTVMHAYRKIRDLMGERRTIYNQVTELTNLIKQAARNKRN
ncbi:chromosomal replication initiator protein DnaA [Auritidibacter sp. NML100628]|uniref:chromosomal replication initiator protein DnaA n=1 Tax=Auritidibacter sp. NML100628 TaxID=2170742 RepID=UPI000D7262A9|nr:chromosomal replication initiator protein DnaA [Auritidibacter sp. NML100628]PXA77048.1 chromosomal replication initiator protein DnaA [Auritidibacter sp. NML100628]PXA81777.1 chromosomal replication initiator protein DnaA [Auritidibacter sp. NML120779]